MAPLALCRLNMCQGTGKDSETEMAAMAALSAAVAEANVRRRIPPLQ